LIFKTAFIMKNISLLLFIGLWLTSCNINNNRSQNTKVQEDNNIKYQLVWFDEFDYSGLPDSTKWAFDTEGNEDGWGNREAQYYTSSKEKNASVKNGVLNIVAHKEDFGGKKYTSARLVSKADWKYGKIEVNAKLPPAKGTWSAIWLMPGGWSFNDGNWPDIGEIDIMEHVGHDLGVVHASAHSKDYQWQTNTQKTATVFIPDVDKEFHSYILEWDPNVLKAFVDDSLYFVYENENLGASKWPYDKPFYLILNVAIGGVWGGEIDQDAFPQTMEIDYVRIYQKDEHSKNE
jgi:beta-glucanase (GH16 family)